MTADMRDFAQKAHTKYTAIINEIALTYIHNLYPI